MSGSSTALVAGGHPEERARLRAALEQAGFDVSETDNGLDAVRLASRTFPDVVVLGRLLRHLSADDALPVIRRRSPHTVVVVPSPGDGLRPRVVGEGPAAEAVVPLLDGIGREVGGHRASRRRSAEPAVSGRDAPEEPAVPA